MPRSLKVSPEYISRVKSSLQRNGYPSQQALAAEVGFSLSTIKNFLNGKPVDYLNFIELCEKLGLDWQEISKTEQVSDDIFLESSPFITGNPITHPRYFFGREREIKRLFNLLKSYPLQNAAIIGKRRSGKTSLLHYIKNITNTPVNVLRSNQKSDWLPHPQHYHWVFVDFQDSRMASQKYLLGHILEGLNISLSGDCNLDIFMEVVSDNLKSFAIILMDEIGTALSRYSELDDDFWNSLRSLGTNQTSGKLAFILAAHESPMENYLKLPPITREILTDDPFTRFDEWLDGVEEILGEKVALLSLDEFEALDTAITKKRFDEEDVLGYLRHLIQHRPKFKIMIAGSHTLAEFGRWASYLINVQVCHVGYLQEEEARKLIEHPIPEFTLRYEPEAAARVLQITRCHPCLVQLLCSEIVNYKNEQPTEVRRLATQKDIEAAIPEALQTGSFFFADIETNQIDATGLKVLQFIAGHGEGKITDSQLLKQQFGQELEAALELLLRRELIESRFNGYCFQVELIRRWFIE